jgi:hypothetical protein
MTSIDEVPAFSVLKGGLPAGSDIYDALLELEAASEESDGLMIHAELNEVSLFGDDPKDETILGEYAIASTDFELIGRAFFTSEFRRLTEQDKDDQTS